MVEVLDADFALVAVEGGAVADCEAFIAHLHRARWVGAQQSVVHDAGVDELGQQVEQVEQA